MISQPGAGLSSPYSSDGESKGPDTSTKGNEVRRVGSGFLILLILFSSLFFLMSLANGLSILFIFSKYQVLVLLIFAIFSFVSFHLFLL